MIWSEYLPRALIVGVSFSDFWGLTPRKLEPFYKAFEEGRRANLDQINFQSWLQGQYFLRALGAAFSKSSSARYPEVPLKLRPDTDKERYDRIKAKTEAWMIRHKYSHTDRKEG